MATPDGGADVNAQPLSIDGAVTFTSPVWGDERGFFREWYAQRDVGGLGVSFPVAQANLSMSVRNVVRGLHYSLAPEGQAKLVTCAFGTLDDVIVDVRVGSPTYGVVEVVHLADDLGVSVFLPAGVAHGFCVTSERAALSYLLSSPFNAPLELEINPFDPAIGVPWPLDGEPIVSVKDAAAPLWRERADASQLPRWRAERV
ncbi:MAG: dTDP-4-dehydrorhamnose 3,5-epimerase family protein [Acidimicrobiales bacterium]